MYVSLLFAGEYITNLQNLWSLYTNPENYKKVAKSMIPQISGDFDPDGTADDHSVAAIAARADIEYSRTNPTLNPLVDQAVAIDEETGPGSRSRRQSRESDNVSVGAGAGAGAGAGVEGHKRRSYSTDMPTFY